MVLVQSAVTSQHGPRIAVQFTPLSLCDNEIHTASHLKKVERRPGGHLVHVGVAHGRRLCDRSYGLGLLDLTRERNAGASRTDHGKHKYFLHEDTPWNRRAHPAPSFLR